MPGRLLILVILVVQRLLILDLVAHEVGAFLFFVFSRRSVDLLDLLLGDHPRGTGSRDRCDLHEIFVRADQRTLQVRDQRGDRGIAVLGLFLHALFDDALETEINVGRELARSQGLALDVLQCDRHGVLPVVGDASGDHLVHGHAQRVDVAALVAVAAARLLRTDIVHGTHGVRTDRLARSRAGNAEVRHLYFSVAGNNDVLGFNVPVDDMLAVGDLDALRDLDGDSDRLAARESALLLDIALQRDTVDEFHDDVVDVVFLSDVIDIDDILMRKARRRLCLRAELLNEIPVGVELGLQDLDRDRTAQLMILRLIDVGCSSRTDALADLIAVA